MAEHQREEDGLDEVELLVQLPHGVDHAKLEHLNLGDLLVFDNALHAVLHVVDGVLVHGGAQID